MIVKLEDIVAAQNQLAEMVIDQARYGAQTRAVQQTDPNMYSLGQFLKQPDREQRGVHGSASGLIVLADQGEDKIVNGIIKYLEQRASMETDSGTERLNRIQRDEHNTIKISEILYALSFVRTGVADKEAYVKKLVEKLRAGKRKRGGQEGWRYFVDDESHDIDMLPTAFAVMALSANGYSEDIALKTLRQHLDERVITDPTSLAEAVFALYVLLRSNDSSKQSDLVKSGYKAAAKKIWNSEFFTIANQYEQNVEYWYESHHEYVRIPWQIYYIVIVSHLSQWRFYAVSTQRLLKAITDSAKKQNFRYPYSGFDISTRTSAIIYDGLKSVQKNFDTNSIYSTGYKLRLAYHNIRLFFGKKAVRWVLASAGIVMLLFTIISWIANPNSRVGSIANEFLGWLCIGLIALGKKR